MLNTNGNNAQPGWYPDPSGQLRYWDGNAWLNIPAPAQQPAAGVSANAPFKPGTHGVGAGSSSDKPRKKMSKAARRWLVVGIIAAVVLVGGSAIGIAIGEANKQAAIAEEEERQREDQEKRDQEEAEAIAAQEAEDDEERQFRLEQVTFIESSIQEMAEEHVADGYIDGPIIDVSCAPTNGGSTDDLTAKTTVFECFVANEDNGDGTMSGHYYNATMNWTDGSFTYGMGRA